MLYNRGWDLDTVGRVLWSAADYMDEHGWYGHGALGPKGEVCMVSAISKAYGVEQIFGPVRDEAYERVRKHLGVRGIVNWNDEVCRSKEQAVAALRGAALQEENKND
jgi:hypothetical protein